MALDRSMTRRFFLLTAAKTAIPAVPVKTRRRIAHSGSSPSHAARSATRNSWVFVGCRFVKPSNQTQPESDFERCFVTKTHLTTLNGRTFLTIFGADRQRSLSNFTYPLIFLELLYSFFAPHSNDCPDRKDAPGVRQLHC